MGPNTLAWIYVVVAGVLEVAWAIGMKRSEGFTRPVESVVTIVLMIASFALLSLGMKQLPAGTAYAVWTGIGAFGTVVVGIVYLHEPATAARLVCLGLLLAGIVGLKVTS